MRILSVSAQKADSTGSGVFLSELVKGFAPLNQQAVVCGALAGELPRHLPPTVQLYPVLYQSEALPFPICGMSDEMPYPSTRYRDLDESKTQQLLEAFSPVLRRAVADFRPDVILCHHLYFAAALCRELFPQLPVYGQCHGSDLRQFAKNPWRRDWIAENIRRLDGIFALHQEQKAQICQLFDCDPQQIQVFGSGYNSGVFFQDPALKGAKNPEKLRLFFAGKLSEKKGVLSLLRALSALQEPQRVELYLAGGAGNEAEYTQIRRLAAQAPCPVQFLGRLDQQELARQLNLSDVFVLPSFYEGLPLVLLEALACGLRCVCSDLPGIRPWLDHSLLGHGVLFVTPPPMENQDEPLAAALPDFERHLAAALEVAPAQPQPDPSALEALSWKGLCQRYDAFWQKDLAKK